MLAILLCQFACYKFKCYQLIATARNHIQNIYKLKMQDGKLVTE